MGTCKHMKTVEDIAKDINRQYSIQLDYEYVERIKRLICGSLCHGVCDPKNIVQRDRQGKHPDERIYMELKLEPENALPMQESDG